jgi:hypothetical protein
MARFTPDTLADLVINLPADSRLWLRFRKTNIETASIATASDALGFFALLTDVDPDWRNHVADAQYRPANGGGSYVRTIMPLAF